MISLIAEVLIVSISSWVLTKKCFNISLFSDAILVCFTLFFGQVVLVETLLGIAGQLYFLNVFVAHLLILLVILLIYRHKKMPEFAKPDIDPFINSNLLILAVSIFLSFFLIKAYSNLINPVQDIDSLLYHLAFPAAWIKSGSLNTPFFIFGSKPILIPSLLANSAPSYYPINGELFFTWFMLPLRNVFLADLGEAPFYFIGITAVYSILTKYNVNSRIALLSGFLWVLIPNIFKQLKYASQLDVICAVLFLLVVFMLLLLKSRFTLKNAILFGVSIGLFVGVKFNNLIWLAALLPFALYVLYTRAKLNKYALSRVLMPSGLIILMIILFGGYMYIKNYFFTGNPMFPVELKISDKTIFKGILDSSAFKTQMYSNDSRDLFRLFKEGLGLQFFFLIFPGTFAFLGFYKYLKTKVFPLKEHMLLFATPLIMLILFKIFIGVYVARYLFVYLSLGLITAVILAAKLSKNGDKYIGVVSFISILAASFELAKGSELVVSVLLSLAIFILCVFYKKQAAAFYKSKNFGRVMFAALLLGSLLLVYLNNKYNNEEYGRYPLSFSKKEAWQADLGRAWKALNGLTGEGARVAYTGRQECLPLYGSGFKNYIKYVSVNAKDITPYNHPDGLYRKIKNYSAWERNLKKEQIEYLFIALPFPANRESEPNNFPIEDEWAVLHGEIFKPVFSNSLAHIYKVAIK